jgi:hypothetical protein
MCFRQDCTLLDTVDSSTVKVVSYWVLGVPVVVDALAGGHDGPATPKALPSSGPPCAKAISQLNAR